MSRVVCCLECGRRQRAELVMAVRTELGATTCHTMPPQDIDEADQILAASESRGDSTTQLFLARRLRAIR